MPAGATGPLGSDAAAADVARLTAALPRPGEAPPDDVAHDAYFRVGRVDGEAAGLFARAAVAARGVLLAELHESPADLSLPLLGLIDRALVDLLACAVGGTVDDRPAVTAWHSPGNRRDVLPRWIRGHQVFAVLTKGLVVSFGAMGRAVRGGDAAGVRRWADLTASLLGGSGAAFVLTADFSVADYNVSIRPSMMPPAVPTCLSGLMSVDHRVLVQTIRALKPALRSLHDHDPVRHATIHAELKTVYDRHIYVCERFVGDRPSLLTAGSTEKSGPALIGQSKAMRLKPFEVARHAARLHGPPDDPRPRGHPGADVAKRDRHEPDPPRPDGSSSPTAPACNG